MSYYDMNDRRRNLARGVHSNREEPGTSQDSIRDSDNFEDTVKNSVKIGDHEVRPVGNLKVLSKKPLEDYFDGTKGKKETKKKTKSRRQPPSVRGFGDTVTNTGLDGIEVPGVESTTEQDSATDEAASKQKQIELQFYKYQKLKESTEKRNHARQKLAEENYLEELENLAETWMEYGKRKIQLKESQHFSQPRSSNKTVLPACSRIGFYILSKKYWHDDQDAGATSGEKEAEITTKTHEDTTQQSGCEEVQEGLQNLVFVDEESE